MTKQQLQENLMEIIDNNVDDLSEEDKACVMRIRAQILILLG